MRFSCDRIWRQKIIYDIYSEWYIYALSRNKCRICWDKSERQQPAFTKTLTHCILLYLTMWSFPSTSFNAIRVMPIIYATLAIYALRSTNTLWFSKHLKEHRQGLSNHLYKELPYEASLSPLFIRCDFVYQGDDTNLEHSNRIHSSKTFHSDNYSILLFSTFQCYVSHLFSLSLLSCSISFALRQN